MDIISIAQQARPKDIGQMELRRAQFTTLSSDARRIPSSLRKLSSSPGLSRVTPLASSTAMLEISVARNLYRRHGFAKTNSFSHLGAVSAIQQSDCWGRKKRSDATGTKITHRP